MWTFLLNLLYSSKAKVTIIPCILYWFSQKVIGKIIETVILEIHLPSSGHG